jgi:hypothetical protein
MILRLYKNFQKHENSTKLPNVEYIETNVTLKKETSLLNPTFLIQGVDLTVNYVYLVDAGRYYFVNDITLGNANIYELSCSIDVLATFRSLILNKTYMIERSASSYNATYNDPYVSVTQQINARHLKITTTGLTSNNGCYIVRIAGGDEDGVSTYAVDSLTTLAPIFNPDKYYSSSDDLWVQMVGNFVFNPYDYVVGLYYCPISYDEIKRYATGSPIKIKWFNTGIVAYKINQRAILSKSGNLNECDNDYSDFRKYNPQFSRYHLDVPAVGLIPLDNNDVEDLRYTIAVSLDTGDAKIWLEKSTSLNVVATFNTNMYTSLQFGSDKQSLTSLLGSSINAIGGFVSGNIPMGVAGTLQTVGNIITPTPSIGGSAGGIGLVYNSAFTMYCENYGTGAIDIINNGRPLYQRRQLSTLSGFTKCSGVSIDIACTSTERTMINSYLNGGFYIE